MTSCHRALTKEIGTGAGRRTIMSAPYIGRRSGARARSEPRGPGASHSRRLAGAGCPTRLLASGVARVPAFFSDPPFHRASIMYISCYRTVGTPPTCSAHHKPRHLCYPSQSFRSVQMAGLENGHCLPSNYRRYGGGGRSGPQATPHLSPSLRSVQTAGL